METELRFIHEEEVWPFVSSFPCRTIRKDSESRPEQRPARSTTLPVKRCLDAVFRTHLELSPGFEEGDVLFDVVFRTRIERHAVSRKDLANHFPETGSDILHRADRIGCYRF